jgi:hypothetical protein
LIADPNLPSEVIRGYREILFPNSGAAQVSLLETVLVYAGISAAVIAVCLGVLSARRARLDRRYRPGRPFVFAPVWLPDASRATGGHTADGAGTGQSGPDPHGVQVPGGATSSPGAQVPGCPQVPSGRHGSEIHGGASGRW